MTAPTPKSQHLAPFLHRSPIGQPGLTAAPLLERGSAELLRALTEVSHAVSNAVSLEQILDLASEQAARLIGAERSLVLLTDGAGGLRVRAHYGIHNRPVDSFAGRLDEGLRASLAGVLGEPSGARVLAVPLVVRGRVTGVFAVAPVEATAPAGPREAILTALADQMAAPLEIARLEEEVRRFQVRAEHAERATGVGVLDWELVSPLAMWSPEIYRLHGIPPGAPATVETWLASVHPDDRERMLAAVREFAGTPRDSAAAPEGLVENEYRVVLPDGALRWIASRVCVVYGPDGRPGRLLGVNLDITERKRAEADLLESEERLRLTTGALAGFLFDWDPVTNAVKWFGGMEEVLGFSLDEISPDVSWYAGRVHPDDLPGARETVRRALESGAAAYSNVYRFRHRQGHYVYVADRGRILRDAEGRPVRVLGGVSDVSERLRFEQERTALLDREREARAAAEAAARARDEVLGIVSHDLGNSLSAIGICASALLEGTDTSADTTRQILQAIHRSADTTSRLIRDLLDVASIEAGRLAIEPHSEAPGDILVQAAEMFAATAREHGITLEARAASGLPAIRADSTRLLQSLANLQTNALKYTGCGGRITLSAEQDSAGVRFVVEDTGCGIASEDLPHVFDRYWQKGRGIARGTGLGLAIVRGIVDAHGGQLSVESSPGQGSRFSFTIPLAS